MRITEGIIAGRSLLDLQRANSAVAKASQQVSTGNRLTRPSDDPQGTERALRLRSELAATNQYMSTTRSAGPRPPTTRSATSTTSSSRHASCSCRAATTP
jgi:flagellin-like hook-associated protein FlgL